MQENYIFIENQQYFDVPEDEDGLPKFYNQNPVFQEDLEIDEVQQVALNSFGIKYLYPWQRIVIANILDAVKAQEKTELYQKQLESGELSKEDFNEIITTKTETNVENKLSYFQLELENPCAF